MRSARQPSHSPHRPDHQPRSVRGAVVDTVVGTAIAMAVLSGLSGCAQVDLDELIGSRPTSASPSPASHASTAPPQMVLPTPLPTGQATAASTATAGFPELAGYTSASPTAASGATTSTTTRSPATSWSRSYVSRSSTCQVSAEVTSSPELVVTGGDDHALSEHWAISLAGEYPEYRQTARMELTAANRSESYAGIATTFSASIAGSQVVGRSFARVWSADSAALPVTHGVPAEELRYDVLGGGCSWHDDRGPIGAVPLAGKITGACNTSRPHLRLSLHLLHEGAPCTTSVPGRPPVTALATAPGPQGDSS